MKFAAVILAGGASRRMGSAKALLPWGKQTLLDHLADLFEPFCQQIIVVLGHNAEQIREGIRSNPQFVINPEPERGQLTSLQTGLRETSDFQQVFFTPLDYPAIRRSTVAAVQAAAGEVPVVPQYRGRHGHPVLIPAAVVTEFLALGPDDTARVVMHRYAPVTRYIDVEDEGILLDADDPEAYRAIMQAAL